MRWQELPQAGQVPGPRSSHALAAVGSKLYLFGGELQPRVPLPAQLYCYDLADDSSSSSSGTWSVLATTGCCPGPRVAATMAAVGDRLYLYGGRTGVDMGEGAKSDLYMFDTAANEWQPVAVAPGSPQPPPRSYHSMAAAPSQGRLYVFGGCGSSGRLSDLWCFDTSSSTWQQMPSSEAIAARGGSVLVAAADGSQLFLLGGFNPAVPSGAELTDCHVFDVASSTWACHPACKAPGAGDAAAGEAAAAAAGGSEGQGDSLAMMLGRSVFGAVLHSSSSGGCGNGGCGAPAAAAAAAAAAGAAGGCEHSHHVVTFGGEVAPSDKGHAGAGNFTDVLLCLAPNSSSSSKWHSLAASGTSPGPRGWFACTRTPDGSMVVHGGLGADNERRGDMFKLCMHA